MAFIDYLLEEPSYGWKNDKGELSVPTVKQLYAEALGRINIFKSKKNWISLLSWAMVIVMLPFFYVFLVYYFSWKLVVLIAFYSMIVMGTHGTIWYHRYCTHKSYKFRHPFWRFLTQNLVIKTIPEETYVVSHHVHHVKSDEPGDPYNAKAGFFYCMLADINHQRIASNLSEEDYKKATQFMRHSGVQINTYKQYLTWGSIATPRYTIGLMLLNWACWYSILYFIGGTGLACALFTAAMLWLVLVRAFNYTGHGKGKEMHEDGIDFDRTNLSINQTRPGLFAGEWHNNHHLYPGSARAGFLPYQIDLAWIYIFCMHRLGAVSSYHDSKKDFLRKYYGVHKEQQSSTTAIKLSPVQEAD